jgi:hypothetical protein
MGFAAEDLWQDLYHDAARRAATVFEKWNCMIENGLPARRGKLPAKD